MEAKYNLRKRNKQNDSHSNQNKNSSISSDSLASKLSSSKNKNQSMVPLTRGNNYDNSSFSESNSHNNDIRMTLNGVENKSFDQGNNSCSENSNSISNNDKTSLIKNKQPAKGQLSDENLPSPPKKDSQNLTEDYHTRRRDSGGITSLHTDNPEDESALTIAKQVALPYIFAAVGLVGAGLVLDKIQHWQVYEEITELYVLVPSLLGLKGNLEMTLASRMSTAANQGILDSRKERNEMIKGNMALIQCQASVVALFAAIIAMTLSWIPQGHFKGDKRKGEKTRKTNFLEFFHPSLTFSPLHSLPRPHPLLRLPLHRRPSLPNPFLNNDLHHHKMPRKRHQP